MDKPPIPKPRTTYTYEQELKKRPIPLPRTILPTTIEYMEEITTDIIPDSAVSNYATISTKKQTSPAATSSNDSGDETSKTKSSITSRFMRDSLTRSVIESTKSKLRLRNSNKGRMTMPLNFPQRSVSVDLSVFGSLNFSSPLVDQMSSQSDENDPQVSMNLDNSHGSLSSTIFDEQLNYVDTDCQNASSLGYNGQEHNISSSIYIYDTPKSVSRASSVSCLSSIPEIPARPKKTEDMLPQLMPQHPYENWTIAEKPVLRERPVDPSPRPSKSMIFEFDPLNTGSTPKYEGVSNELLLLQSFLIGDMYGTIVANDNNEDNIDYSIESEYFNPPIPPERSDSLFAIVNDSTTATRTKSNFNSYINDTVKDDESKTDDVTNGAKHNTSVKKRFTNILKLDSVLQKSVKQNGQKIVQRPSLSGLPAVFYSGSLTRVLSGVVEDLFKNAQQRYCVLSEHKLACYSDPKHSVLKEEVSFDCIYSVQIVLPLTSSTTGKSFCFEIIVSTGSVKNAPRKLLFSCNSVTERRTWVLKIVDNLTNRFPVKYTAEFSRCGWSYLKEGVSGEWDGAWIMLIRRQLAYYMEKDSTIKFVDLRKTRCVATQEADETTKLACPNDGSSNLLLDCPDATLYLRFPHEKELKGWRRMVKLAAHNNGTFIHHQQLTKEDVPTIVDKCINFLYAYGSLSEGIYRRAGSSVVVTDLLNRFRRDAWSVQLSPADHTEHDVAGVLKRFFRHLPEPLISKEVQLELIAALEIKDKEMRLATYHRVMWDLPQVARNTARKLFAHLHFLQSMSYINRMTADNLASVWMPTIMPGDLKLNKSGVIAIWGSQEVLVVRDFIAHYDIIYPPSDAEKRRDDAVRMVLTRVTGQAPPTTHKAAGDLRTWVYIKNRNTCCQIALTPNKTGSDVCIELCDKTGVDSHLLMLEEVICGESMKRIIHIDEVVLDVVLRWGYWDEDDRKDNYLLMKENSVLQEIEAIRGTSASISGELKFADECSKAFKKHTLEFKESLLTCTKSNKGSRDSHVWHIKDILWYMGHEAKRVPNTRWAITLIPRESKPKRSKEQPYFGCTIAGCSGDDRIRWMAAMMCAEHKIILPTPRLILT